MTSLAPKTSGTSWLARLLSLIFLVLACSAMPQQAKAQGSANAIFSLPPETRATVEGGRSVHIINLSAAVNRDVSITWSAIGGTATVSEDLERFTGTVIFPANDTTSRSFNIDIVDDMIDEGNETYTVTIRPTTTLPRGVIIDPDNDSTEATILDNDESVSIFNRSAAENVAGGISFAVILDQTVESDVVLDVAYAAGSASLDDDLGGDRTTRVMIVEGQDRATFVVPIINDNIIEGDETFTVTISENATTPLPRGVIIGRGTATGTIIDDDRALVTLSPAELSATEDGTFTYTVKLSATVDEAVDLTWTATTGVTDTATVGEDLQEITGTVSFVANNNADRTFTIRPVDDMTDEVDETFTVTIEPTDTLPTGVTIDPDKRSSAATILDNDDAPPPENAMVNIADMTAVEDAGAIDFTVSLSRAVGNDVTLAVDYTARSADPGTDLGTDLGTGLGTPLPTTVMIVEGETSATLTVPVIDDTTVEEDETFIVTLSEDPANSLPDDVSIGDGVATGTITDNDEPPLTISIDDAAPVAENGIARFTITLGPRALTGDAVFDIAYTPGPATGDTQPAIPEEDLGSDRPTTVTIPAGNRNVVLEVPITDDEVVEGRESFTVTLSTAVNQPDDPETGRPPDLVLLFPSGADATGIIDDNDVAAPPVAEPSVLTGPRLIGAGTALRRHVGRFDSLTGTVVRNRLDARETRRLSGSENLGDGALAASEGLGGTGWGTWIDGAWAGFGGTASGRQADIYGGLDYLDGDWLVGALIGYEVADLEVGAATYKSDYTHVGLYGGARLSEDLLFDGAATYGMATPDIALGNVSASYDANRFTARGALTGDFGFEYGSMRVEPQLGLLYSREKLGAFTDSVGGVAERTTLRLGRFSAGPRLTWAFDGGRVDGGARVQWDFLELDDGVDGRVSGAADIGVRFDLTPSVTLGVQGDIDGIGISDEFGSLGGKVQLGVRF